MGSVNRDAPRPCEQCAKPVELLHHLTRFCRACVVQRMRGNGKAKAHAAVARAVARGELPRASTLTCVDCGRAAMDYDHRDYSKPLQVEPVCRSCNKKRGPGLAVTDSHSSSICPAEPHNATQQI